MERQQFPQDRKCLVNDCFNDRVPNGEQRVGRMTSIRCADLAEEHNGGINIFNKHRVIF